MSEHESLYSEVERKIMDELVRLPPDQRVELVEWMYSRLVVDAIYAAMEEEG